MSTLGKPPKLQRIDKRLLSVDPKYQRSLESARSQKLVAKIAAEFAWAKFQVIAVTSDHRIVDGQHRHAAAMLREDVSDVPCLVLPIDNMAEAAALFVAINRERIALTPLMVFKAELVAQAPEALAVVKLCLQAGAEPLTYPQAGCKPNQTMAISTLKAQIKTDPDRALIALRAAVKAEIGLTAVVLQAAFRAAVADTPEERIVEQLAGMRGVSFNSAAHGEQKRRDVFFGMMTGDLAKPEPAPAKPSAPVMASKARKPFEFKRGAVVAKTAPVEIRGDVPVRRFEMGAAADDSNLDYQLRKYGYTCKRASVRGGFVVLKDGADTGGRTMTKAELLAFLDKRRQAAGLAPILQTGRRA